MSKYTIKDVEGIIPQNLTDSARRGVEEYLNNGTIPPYDPCQSCEPNYIRKLIATIQVAERNGLFPPARKAEEPQEEEEAVELGDLPEGYDYPAVDFTKGFTDN